MSETVDTRFAPGERDQLLAEVRESLPAFLSAGATEQHRPVGDVSDLLNLEQADLERVVSVHLLLTDTIRTFVSGLARGLRLPITSSVRPKELTQAIRGPIDWGATIAARAIAAGDRTLHVVRPGRRIFNTPENQALQWALHRLDAALANVPRPRFELEPDEEEEAEDPVEAGWFAEIDAMRAILLGARRVRWLQEVEPRRPDAATMLRLGAARTSFYRLLLANAVRAIERWLERPTDNDLVDLLRQRWFRPSRDWQLFEVVVALRLIRAFAEVSPLPRQARLLVSAVGGRSTFARYRLADGDEIRLWYQRWPTGAGPSILLNTAKRQELRAEGTRPDIVVERAGASPDCVVLELKASRSPGYLGEGLAQLLGYVTDRSKLLGPTPCGWLVAPTGGPFTSVAPDSGPLWMVTADEVALAARQRFVESAVAVAAA